MEQSGFPGLVHLTADAAELLSKEMGAGPPPLHMTKIKSKGAVPTAWCVRGEGGGAADRRMGM